MSACIPPPVSSFDIRNLACTVMRVRVFNLLGQEGCGELLERNLCIEPAINVLAKPHVMRGISKIFGLNRVDIAEVLDNSRIPVPPERPRLRISQMPILMNQRRITLRRDQPE